MITKIKNSIKTFAKICQHKPIAATINIIEPTKLLEDKIALITGGTSGIGKAIAEILFKSGATVIITSRSRDKADKVAKQISADRVFGIELDSTDIINLQNKLNEIKEILNGRPIDILVNNAGLNGGDIRYDDEEAFDKIINTNLKSIFFLSRLIAKDMIKNHVKGNILNIASSSSLRPAISAYALSKWGVRGLTQGLAKMLAPHRIVVNGLAPGPTATPMLGKKDYSDIALPTSPIGRYALPEEIAAMALFLCGPQGRTIIGDIVYMTGGAGIIENNDINYDFIID